MIDTNLSNLTLNFINNLTTKKQNALLFLKEYYYYPVKLFKNLAKY